MTHESIKTLVQTSGRAGIDNYIASFSNKRAGVRQKAVNTVFVACIEAGNLDLCQHVHTHYRPDLVGRTNRRRYNAFYEALKTTRDDVTDWVISICPPDHLRSLFDRGLHLAAGRGDLKRVQQICDVTGKPGDEFDKKLRSAFLSAAKKFHIDVVDYLRSQMRDPDDPEILIQLMRDDHKSQSLHDVFSRMVHAGVRVNPNRANEKSPLAIALQRLNGARRSNKDFRIRAAAELMLAGASLDSIPHNMLPQPEQASYQLVTAFRAIQGTKGHIDFPAAWQAITAMDDAHVADMLKSFLMVQAARTGLEKATP